MNVWGDECRGDECRTIVTCACYRPFLPPSPTANTRTFNSYIRGVLREKNRDYVDKNYHFFSFLTFLSASVQGSQSACPFVTVQGTLAVQKIFVTTWLRPWETYTSLLLLDYERLLYVVIILNLKSRKWPRIQQFQCTQILIWNSAWSISIIPI